MRRKNSSQAHFSALVHVSEHSLESDLGELLATCCKWRSWLFLMTATGGRFLTLAPLLFSLSSAATRPCRRCIPQMSRISNSLEARAFRPRRQDDIEITTKFTLDLHRGSGPSCYGMYMSALTLRLLRGRGIWAAKERSLHAFADPVFRAKRRLISLRNSRIAT